MRQGTRPSVGSHPTCAWMRPMRPLRSVTGSCRCSNASGRRPTFSRVRPVRQATVVGTTKEGLQSGCQ